MSSYNRVILLGHLTRDPELRYTPGGNAVSNIGLALNRTWKNEDGEKQEEVTFVDCTAWGKTAEIVALYCRKGLKLMVEGYLKTESWEDKRTQAKRSRIVVVLERVNLIDFYQADDDGRPKDPGGRPTSIKPTPETDQPDEPNPGDDEEVPF